MTQIRIKQGNNPASHPIGAVGSDFYIDSLTAREQKLIVRTEPTVEGLSIVIPMLNEQESVKELLQRIDRSLRNQEVLYEVIVVDDHSTDATRSILARLAHDFPVTVHLKQGQPGKAYSLLEGFTHARYGTIAMIDADLQYPPEALFPMWQKIRAGAGVVVANRKIHHEPALRRLASRSFSFLFTRLLHGLTCDVQAGLKMFQKDVLIGMELAPTAWTFDLAFLLHARDAGYGIDSVDITFAERRAGRSKINLLRAAWEIGFDALALRLIPRLPVALAPTHAGSMHGAGVAYRGKRFITHTTLDWRISALYTFIFWQKAALVLAACAAVLGFIFAPLATGLVLVAILSALYFLDAAFNLYLVHRSLTTTPALQFSHHDLRGILEHRLPVYSILCPLYREASVVRNFVEGLERLEWPHDKLDALLLLEEDDRETQAAVAALKLPSYIRAIIVPHSLPKTKPKACNFGLSLARGDYIVIYDAEDIPDPLQLKKAYLGFQRVPRQVRCLQAKLNYFNWSQNLLTRLFTAEYSLWFDVMLPGMQSVGTSIPLGGTSNHFRTQDLKDLEGWDSFNVTEDCDLGIRLFRRGYRTAIIDSVTLEEANSDLGNWIRQRSRWLKGYLQTYLVHMRNPVSLVREYGTHAVAFQFIVGVKVFFLMVNPLMWAATIAYFAANSTFGSAIESLYPGPVLTLGIFSLIFGNFFYFYCYMIGCALRGHWRLLKYVYLIPFYWIFISVASYVAFYQLLVKPHYWEKTRHGLHLRTPELAHGGSAFSVVRGWVTTTFSYGRRLGALPGAAWQRVGDIFAGGSVLVGAMLVSNIFNFVFNAFLGRVLDFADLGLVVLVTTLWYIAGQFLGALGSTVTHRSAFLAAARGNRASVAFRRATMSRAIVCALVLCVLWIAAVPFTGWFFNLADAAALVWFTPSLLFGTVIAVYRGWLQGTVRFTSVAVLFVVESIAKLVFAAVFVWGGFPSLVYLCIPLSVAVTALVAVLLIVRGMSAPSVSSRDSIKFPRLFFAAALLVGLSMSAFLSLDIVLVKHFLSPVFAGQYALLTLTGKVVYFLGALPAVFIVTLVSRDVGLGRDPRATFIKLFASTALITGVSVVALGPAGEFTVPLLFGARAEAIIPYLTPYVSAIGLFSLAHAVVTYHVARKRYAFSVVALVASVLLAVGIALRHDSVSDIVDVILAASVSLVAGVFVLHAFYRLRTAPSQKEKTDAASLGYSDAEFPFRRRRILVFNWRDLRHVFAGGAEAYIQRMAQQWVAQGYQVTLFCGNDGHSVRYEHVRGVEIVRRGGFYLVYLWAAVYYLLYFRGKYDVIVDCHNGVPFFTPLYTREPVFCLMYHVHQEVFRTTLWWPLAVFAQFLERDLTPIIYKRVQFITISDSSKQAIIALGLAQAGIHIVHPGVDLHTFVRGVKSPTPTVLYLGRLQLYKSIDVLLRAFKRVVEAAPGAQLLIAGGGEDAHRLRVVANLLQLGGTVAFLGKVSETQKVELMQRAWVFVNPSFIEGWGITTIEANACGTPVVAADVPGLRDSVNNLSSGFLVPYGDETALAVKIQNLIQDHSLRDRLGVHAYRWARNFDERVASEQFLNILESAIPERIAGLSREDVRAVPASVPEM